ncbi:MAG TPA: hypothetical protein VL989_01655 [Candidatus Sulfotelmatobacter sp.]|nr:hypothetical protein [Candidatus Sulfotelmatobacter sp.]
MRLSYETGKATLIQFIVLSLLNIVDAVYSIVSTCTNSSSNQSDCATNALSSVVFYMLIVCWFGIIAFVGYAAQSKRSKRIAQLLILMELSVLGVAAVNIKLGISSHSNALSMFTSLIDLILAAWIISLAFRLMRAGDKRVVNRARIRHQKIN